MRRSLLPPRRANVCANPDSGEEGVASRTYLGVTIKVDGGLWLCAQPRA